MRCDDSKDISVHSNGLWVDFIPDRNQPGNEVKYPREALKMFIELLYEEFSMINIPVTFIPSSLAFECPDNMITLLETMKGIEIFEKRESEFINVTDSFVIMELSEKLDISIEEYLHENSTSLVYLFAEYSPVGDSVEYMVEVKLSNDSVYRSNLKVALE